MRHVATSTRFIASLSHYSFVFPWQNKFRINNRNDWNRSVGIFVWWRWLRMAKTYGNASGTALLNGQVKVLLEDKLWWMNYIWSIILNYEEDFTFFLYLFCNTWVSKSFEMLRRNAEWWCVEYLVIHTSVIFQRVMNDSYAIFYLKYCFSSSIYLGYW